MARSLSASAVSQSALILSRQVQWNHPMVVQGGIDQTRLAIADGISGRRPGVPFSFTVMGDTDAGELAGQSRNEASEEGFSAMFAQEMLVQTTESRFLLHTGDVTYPIGSYQNYFSGFLKPYQSLLASVLETASYGCRQTGKLNSSPVVFNRPILPVPGNHDYAQLPFWSGCCQKMLRFWSDRLHQFTGIDLGAYGGQGGEAYGQTFLDNLSNFSPEQLKQHLLNHYGVPIEGNSSSSSAAYCLNYAPGQFTRLPNRYYSFHYGGIDFFALDSNTWKTAPEMPGFDQDQLDWLEQGLVRSWQSPDSVGRIVYLHHSPYTTERSRWQQSETLWVRRHFRQVLNNVKATLALDLGEYSVNSSPLVDLVISGHAHCLEHLKTTQTGQGDANLNWLVCGGSGTSLRRQRETGTDILETIEGDGRSVIEMVAQSQLYVGLHRQKTRCQHFHSFVQIDVCPNAKKGLVVRPFVVVKGQTGWQTQALEEIAVGGSFLGHSRYFRDRYSQGSVDNNSSVAKVT